MLPNETKNERATQGVKHTQTSEDLSKELIQHLSKEIETTTTNMMVYRSKIAFAVFLGPFLLLLAVVANTRGLSISLNLSWIAIVAIGSVWCLSFLTLAFMNARIEQQAWRQCNRWRQIILEIYNDPSSTIRPDNLCDDLYKKTSRTQIVYVTAYAVLLASFIMSLLLLTKLRTQELPAKSPAPSTSFDSEGSKSLGSRV